MTIFTDDLNNQSIEKQLIAIRQSVGYAIKCIKNPSLEVQLEAVRQNGFVIEYIKNPCKEVQMEAVKQNGHAIRWIKNPCEEVLTYLYGELTNIKLNNEVCNKCRGRFCLFYKDEYVRSGCPYLIEHKVLS